MLQGIVWVGKPAYYWPVLINVLQLSQLLCHLISMIKQPETITLKIGTLVLNYQTKQVSRDNQELTLQPIPWQILSILMQAHPRVVSRTELCDQIWGDDHTDSDALRSHLYQLRKIVDKPFTHPLIKTMHGIGFCLATTDTAIQ
ncbi:hypothetical protein B1199_16865 [Pseudoalteromonas ulvae]|uniref:OmpR/PhoB-type domain-containing protein n=2 Tax=Pseudoalteromonas ulvae TaxID=107327 RepID=A0A244CLC2_PSEDV|nr:hypothetical protein B1199_16865 [Pseudoalteromonas ulvae]